ncbi:MAG: NAD(P)H-hydrate dehydratase [Paludibacteraceae bacterium]|nr:NAD(P)H-hydrate dehydratase [Paludibacteraceae bacterium]
METARFTALDAARLLPERNEQSAKWDYGHALLCTGHTGMMGAAILCARACIHSGAGLVTVLTEKEERGIVQTAVPEALLAWELPQRSYQAIGAGCGWGTEADKAALLAQLLQREEPLVLDADALNLLARKQWLDRLPAGTVITPHEGEFDRLFGTHSDRDARIQTAVSEAEKRHIVILLKGHETLVCADQQRRSINTTGNAGMATGGSGDVLTGIITGLLARGLESFDAACLGAWIHGKSGDAAAKNVGMDYLDASEIILHMPQAFRELNIPSSSIPKTW